MTIYDLILQFVSFLAMFCVVMPFVAGFLTFHGLKAFGILDPPPGPQEPGKAPQGGWVPLPKLTFGLCLKAFYGATFTTFLCMVVIARILPGIGLPNALLRLAVCVIIQSILVVVLIRRFRFVGIAVVLGTSLLTSSLAFGTAYFVRQMFSA